MHSRNKQKNIGFIPRPSPTNRKDFACCGGLECSLHNPDLPTVNLDLGDCAFVDERSPIANGTPLTRSAVRLTLEPRQQPHSVAREERSYYSCSLWRSRPPPPSRLRRRHISNTGLRIWPKRPPSQLPKLYKHCGGYHRSRQTNCLVTFHPSVAETSLVKEDSR
ncbi:unnamed protein product [Schistocephalus solidus]|uniref:Uncharacterized protein n=1 Tax=Schistocephalus solidus TaxID=70667 RepID=A0A183T1F5_SCHSO|nr:unnamed protein product [Schistocephalus solidus]